MWVTMLLILGVKMGFILNVDRQTLENAEHLVAVPCTRSCGLGGHWLRGRRGSGTSGLCTIGHCKLIAGPFELFSLLLISRIGAHLLQSSF